MDSLRILSINNIEKYNICEIDLIDVFAYTSILVAGYVIIGLLV